MRNMLYSDAHSSSCSLLLFNKSRIERWSITAHITNIQKAFCPNLARYNAIFSTWQWEYKMKSNFDAGGNWNGTKTKILILFTLWLNITRSIPFYEDPKKRFRKYFTFILFLWCRNCFKKVHARNPFKGGRKKLYWALFLPFRISKLPLKIKLPKIFYDMKKVTLNQDIVSWKKEG